MQMHQFCQESLLTPVESYGIFGIQSGNGTSLKRVFEECHARREGSFLISNKRAKAPVGALPQKEALCKDKLWLPIREEKVPCLCSGVL